MTNYSPPLYHLLLLCKGALKMLSKVLTIFSLLCLAVSLSGADVQPQVSEAVMSAMDKLPEEARPLRMMRAKNGATYAKLHNGCEIIVMEKHSAPVVAVQGWMRTGGIHEFDWSGAGLSHFCEHIDRKSVV